MRCMHAPPAVNRPPWRGQLRHFQPVAAQRLARYSLVGGGQPLGQGRRVVLHCASPMLTVAGMPRLSTRLDSVSANAGPRPRPARRRAGVVAGQHGGEFLAADASSRPQHAARDIGEGLEHQIPVWWP